MPLHSLSRNSGAIESIPWKSFEMGTERGRLQKGDDALSLVDSEKVFFFFSWFGGGGCSSLPDPFGKTQGYSVSLAFSRMTSRLRAPESCELDDCSCKLTLQAGNGCDCECGKKSHSVSWRMGPCEGELLRSPLALVAQIARCNRDVRCDPNRTSPNR